METSAQSAQSLPRENAGPHMSPQQTEHYHQTQWPRWQNPEEDKLDRRNIIQNSESLLPSQLLVGHTACQPQAETTLVSACSWHWHTDAMRSASALLSFFLRDWAEPSFLGMQSSTSSPAGYGTSTTPRSRPSFLTLFGGWRRPCTTQPTQRYARVLPLLSPYACHAASVRT